MSCVKYRIMHLSFPRRWESSISGYFRLLDPRVREDDEKGGNDGHLCDIT